MCIAVDQIPAATESRRRNGVFRLRYLYTLHKRAKKDGKALPEFPLNFDLSNNKNRDASLQMNFFFGTSGVEKAH
jgi:hypothetical protein